MRPYGLMFHHFHGSGHPCRQGSISADELADMLGFVGRDRILPAREWMGRALRGTLRETDICLTFDDGLRCQYEVARPVLREHGLTAFWFVYSLVLEGGIDRLEVYRRFRDTCYESIDAFYAEFFELLDGSAWAGEVDRALRAADTDAYLSEFPFYTSADRRFRYVRDEVLGPQKYCQVMGGMMQTAHVDPADLAAGLWMDGARVKQLHEEGHVVGLHSHTHPTRLTRLNAAAQEREYRTNRDCLVGLLGERPQVVSHPCNSYNEDTLRILRDLGILLGFRANMAESRRSELEYPREDHANVLSRMVS